MQERGGKSRLPSPEQPKPREGDQLNFELADVYEQAQARGWSSVTGTLSGLQTAARRLRWSEVTIRTSERDFVTELKPLTQEEARPASLSATYGLDEQPLHSDGAHLRNPPDVVVFVAETPCRTPTLLWTLATSEGRSSLSPKDMDDLHNGLFVVDGGSDAFLATAYSNGGWRFDRGCMRPADERRRRVDQLVLDFSKGAHPHDWSEPNQILVIDNSKTLHARSAMRPGSPRPGMNACTEVHRLSPACPNVCGGLGFGRRRRFPFMRKTDRSTTW